MKELNAVDVICERNAKIEQLQAENEELKKRLLDAVRHCPAVIRDKYYIENGNLRFKDKESEK